MMSNVNHENRPPVVSYAVPHEVARVLKEAPVKIGVIFYSYLAVGLGSFVFLVFSDTANAEKYRFFGILAFLFSFALSVGLRRLFMGRAVAVVSRDLTALTGQPEAFTKALSDTLLKAPWSKWRIVRGRYKKPRFEDIMVLLKDGSYTSMNITEDFSNITIGTPKK